MKTSSSRWARSTLVGLVAVGASLLAIVGSAGAAGASRSPAPRSNAVREAPPAAAGHRLHRDGSVAIEAQRGGAGMLAATVLYDNTGNPVNLYYAGQGGNEAIDDLHLIAGGTPDTLTFEYIETGAGDFEATVRIFGNPAGADLAATPLIGTYSVSGLSPGRHIVAVPLTDAPSVTAHVWVGVQFTSSTAGLIVKSVPSVGSSHDIYLEDPEGAPLYFGGNPLANFALRLVDSPSHDLTIATVGSGSVTKTPNLGSFVEGSTVELTPVPDAHWHFVGWSGDASGDADPLSVTMDGPKSITATFAIDTYTLSYTPGPNGTISGTATQVVDHGADGTSVTAVPNPGYRFVRWSDGVLTAARTDLGVTSNLSVTAFFDVLDLSCNGGFETDSLGWSRSGSGSLLRVRPGHESDWALRVRSSSSSDVGIDDSPNCIQGAFAGDRYRFSVWAKAGSWSSLNRPVKLRVYEYAGSSQVGSYVSTEIRLTSEWTRLVLDYVVRRDGSSLSERILYDPNNSGEFVYLDDIMIEPIDHPVRFTISASAGIGGAISPSGAVLVKQGDSRTFTITPNPGFKISDVVVDSGSEGAIGSYTFTNVQAIHTIQASFVPIPPGENLVANPSFEDGIQGWSRYGSAILTWANDGHASARSLRITGGDGSFGCDDTPNRVARVAGAGVLYRFKAWVKAGSATTRGKVKIRVYEYSGSSQVGSTVYSTEIPLTTEWQELTVSYRVRQANTTLSMRVTDSPSASIESFLVDDVSIVQVASEPGLALFSESDPAATVQFVRPSVSPNPARGVAVLGFSLATRGSLRAEVYDVAGRRLRVLADDREAEPGAHLFPLEGERGTKLGAGIYFYRVEIDGLPYRGRFVILQ